VTDPQPVEPTPADGSTIFRIPRSHWHATLGTFEWDHVRPAGTRVAVEKFLARAEAGEAPHLILTGAPGAGKSHLSVGVYRWMTARVGTLLATWLHVPEWVDRCKASFGQQAPDPWPELQEARRFVALDDLFGREWSAWDRDQVLTRLIDTAYTNRAAVLITMNPSVEELSVRLLGHEVSRLLADAVVVPMSASMDHRRKRGGV
jgi:DNA replication protein DnaC